MKQEMKSRPESARRSVIGLYVEVEMDGVGISDSLYRVCDSLGLELTLLTELRGEQRQLVHEGGGWEAHGKVTKVKLVNAYEDPRDYIQKVVETAKAYAEGEDSALKLHRAIRDMAEAYGVELDGT